ncbi:uncharacterized RING finger protein P8B7.15c-like [Solanum tuberosum]|uniref:uncharacterized RING finger protein P8B7.15c-like n=1 Tax=Solanum tuberosum TaxID=4113 RepID=UPI00073A4A8B|nr:PREDICTED: uncharacterized RING finger protein P8B7.15c-like [Solanum tuberosum]
MAVYIKYKSCKDYDSIPILDHFISVGNLKSKIFESKRYGWGKDFDLLLTNVQTNEDYVDHATLIPASTSVLIRRLPGLPCCPILIKEDPKQVVCKQEEVHSVKKESKYSQDDDFGDDVYAIPKVVMPSQLGNPVPTSTSSIIKNSIVNISLEYNNNTRSAGFSVGQGGMERKKPPPGYVCHRCKVPGHFIQHCPTNGDPNYDIKKVNASVAVLMAAFTKEVEGSSSSSSSKRSYRDIPAELHCLLCKGLMKDANILVDALLPNLTLRATVNRILQSCRTRVEEFPRAVEEVNMKKPSE